MIKTKKQMYIVIASFFLIILLGTTTYAFFNYTRTGTANIIRTGQINFNSEQGTAINLTNLFPIDVSEGIPNDATKVGTVTINITGDTTYGEGIEYLVSAVNVTNTVGSKFLPISIDVAVESNTENSPATTLGTSSNDYYNDRGSTTSYYSVLANDVISNNSGLVVGYIAPGQTGVDGNIVIRAYIDKAKVLISDTYPSGIVRNVITTGYSSSDCETALTGVTNASTYCVSASSLQTAIDNGDLTDAQITLLVTAGIVDEYTDGTPASMAEGKTVFTTTEWNSLQQDGVSFQVKVEANEGIWVDNPNTLYNKVKAMSIGTMNSATDFGTVASSDTTNHPYGVYQLVESNLENPIYFFRGDHTVKNNVIFDNKCWLVVRTTETNSTRMIYNGTPTDGHCTTTTGNDTMISLYQSDSVNSDGNYDYSYTSTTGFTTLKSGTSFKYNANYNNAKNVGYTYDNGVSSNMKNALEAWYEGAISSEAKTIIETSTYCNDTTQLSEEEESALATTLNWSSWWQSSDTMFTPLKRTSANTPSVLCPNGANVISSKVGFLTVDEVIMAGRTWSTGMQDYLYNYSYWWLGSPSFWGSGYAYVFVINNAYNANSCYNLNYGYGLRPVVSITSNTVVSGGDGSQETPWLIS